MILLDFAERSISQPKKIVEAEEFLLIQKLEQLDFLDKQLQVLKRKIVDLFIETEGAVILTVGGIGVSSGAEMGDTSDFDHAGQLIKMAGTNPIVKQSGGRNPSCFRDDSLSKSVSYQSSKLCVI